MNAKAYEFQMSVGFTERTQKLPNSLFYSIPVWGGHFREDENDELGIRLAQLNLLNSRKE